MHSLRHILLNQRGLRALAAVILMVALVTVFLLDQREREGLRLKTLETAIEMNWRLNDVIVEALMTRNIVNKLIFDTSQNAAERATGFDDLLLHYELLWSNVEIAQRTDLQLYDSFASQLWALQHYLMSVEDTVYGDSLPDRDFLVGFAEEVYTSGIGLQRAWQNTQYYGVQMFIGQEEERFAQTQAVFRERIVMTLIGLLTLYLLVEAYLAGNMQRAGVRLKEEALLAAKASEAKSVFLANVSHEIRTPLNGILGMASELEETSLNKDQRACLRVISHAGDVLLHTLNDVLDLSKVEAGQLDTEKRVFDLHDLLDSAVDLYRARAEEKQLDLCLERAPDVPRYVEGDSQRISQVLHNLIGNAIKFTDAGRVTLRVSATRISGYVGFSVIDTGVGIDSAVHDKIFEPFAQADGSVTRTKGGTGLGLSICRGLCDAMGGYLSLDSRLGHGATFHFELPLPQRSKRIQDAAFRAMAHGASDSVGQDKLVVGRVLVVDDNSTNRILLRRFLRGVAEDIVEAGDGLAAVDAVKEAPFDVILMDVQMPVLDGIAATKMIRDIEARMGRSPTCIIAVTANVMRHQVEGYRAGGVDAVLGKPISKAALLEALGPRRRSAA